MRMTLNRRHKAGLFLTLVAVGCGLFLEVSVKQAVGITLLGIAFSWLIGSLNPRALIVAVAVLLCAVGLYVAGSPVWLDWESTQRSASEYDVGITDLQAAIKGAVILDMSTAQPIQGTKPKGADPIRDLGLVRTVKIPESAKEWMRPEAKPKGDWFVQNAPEQRVFPNTMSDAEIVQFFRSSVLLPRPTFSLRPAVHAHAWSVFGGLALFASGLSILVWMLRLRSKDQVAS